MDQQHHQPPPEDIAQYRNWWAALSLPWKTAFNEIILGQTSTADMPDEALNDIWQAPALRFAGPSAPYPNMSIELEDLSGVLDLPRLEIFVFTFQKIDTVVPIGQLTQLKSLFLFNNRIRSLDGVETLTDLQELYVNVNAVESLRPLEHLTRLHTLYCNYNRLRLLDGIGKQHVGTLKQFVCLPNEFLPDAEVIRMERDIGIRCLAG